eukprot:UN11081
MPANPLATSLSSFCKITRIASLWLFPSCIFFARRMTLLIFSRFINTPQFRYAAKIPHPLQYPLHLPRPRHLP